LVEKISAPQVNSVVVNSPTKARRTSLRMAITGISNTLSPPCHNRNITALP
jgi:hypothetical protein